MDLCTLTISVELELSHCGPPAHHLPLIFPLVWVEVSKYHLPLPLLTWFLNNLMVQLYIKEIRNLNY